jgi:hypothetical protein
VIFVECDKTATLFSVHFGRRAARSGSSFTRS